MEKVKTPRLVLPGTNYSALEQKFGGTSRATHVAVDPLVAGYLARTHELACPLFAEEEDDMVLG